MVRQVGQRPASVADAKAECLASLVRNLSHENIEAFEPIFAAVDHVERPVAAELMRADREMRRRHGARQQIDRLDTLLGKEQACARVRSVAGSEERKPVRVIPMQVAEEDRAAERRAVEDTREIAQTRSRIENQRRRAVIVSDCDAGGVSSHVVEVRPYGGCRPACTTDPDAHDQASSLRWPVDNASSAWRSICALATAATLHGVMARRVDVRRPPSSAARSPTTAPGPSSATIVPSTSTDNTPSSKRNSSSPSVPCSTSAAPFFTLRISGFWPPRMIELDSSRSSAVSTS